ncbi:MAG: alpha-hydroxy acid oxidase, partial [Jiangellaceae bacterium]
MRPRDVRPLLRFQPPELDHTRRVLRNCHTIDDLRRAARRALPRGVFDYIDGGAEDEITMRANTAAYADVQFRPRTLRDISSIDTATTILGEPAALPLALSPTGFTRMMHHSGELAVARAAAAARVPYTLSTMGTTSLEDVATTPLRSRWFQLYVWRDRGLTRELLSRAQAADYRALFVTVDTPVPGMRERDARNGFTIPPALTARTLADLAAHPRWWSGFLRGEPLTFANVSTGRSEDPSGVMDYVARQFDPSVTWDDLATYRDQWTGPLVVKGVMRPDDARRALDAGAQGVVVSNHGGRQLDRAIPTLRALVEIKDAVGAEMSVLIDSGIRRGSDIAAAVALGADAVMIGRPYLYGLAAGGEAGVAHALDLFSRQLRRVMQLIGVTSVRELARGGGDTVRAPASGINQGWYT